MPLPLNPIIHLPFLGAGGYNLFVNGLDTTATVPGFPPTAMVASMPDLNGDLVPELIVGIPGDDETTTNAGRVYVVFGNAATAPCPIDNHRRCERRRPGWLRGGPH